MKLSTLQLVDLTGFAQRTVKKRLAGLTPEIDGPAHRYDSAQALPLLYGIGDASGDRLDPSQERARLDVARRQLAELEHARRSGELIPGAEVLARWQGIAGIVRSRLLAIPTRVAGLAAHRSAAEIEPILKAEVRQVLTELAEPNQYGSDD